MNTPARSRRQPVPELLDLVRALAWAQAGEDTEQWLAKQQAKGRKAAA